MINIKVFEHRVTPIAATLATFVQNLPQNQGLQRKKLQFKTLQTHILLVTTSGRYKVAPVVGEG